MAEINMTEADIVINYRQAKFKYKQIGILADMNLTGRGAIIEILRRHGVYEEPKNKKTKGKESNGRKKA